MKLDSPLLSRISRFKFLTIPERLQSSNFFAYSSGNCHVVFFINISEKTNFSYELIEVPFLKTIYQLKYTYQNEILFLGNDQIIYAISPAEPTKAVPIFNEDYHVVWLFLYRD